MRLFTSALLFVMFSAAGQIPDQGPIPHPPPHEEDERLPNGKSKKDALAKQAHDKSLEDARELVKVAQELQSEIEKSEPYVVSVSEIRKTEEIEKLAKRIRGRLKSY